MKAKLIVAAFLALCGVSAAHAQCNSQGIAGSVCASPASGAQGFPSFQQTFTLGAVGGSTGAITLKGATSGSASVSADSTGQLLLGNNVGNKSTIFNDGATNGTSFIIAGSSGVIANTFQLNPALATIAPSLQITGTDSNISLVLQSKGTGAVSVKSTGTNSGIVTLNGGTSGSASISVPLVAGTPSTLQLPTTNGSANNFLQTNGSGVLSWAQPVVTVKKQVFINSGTYTPSTGMLYAIIECVGGGGGGGGVAGAATFYMGAGGGGAGGYSRVLVTAATVGGSQTVTIGALGAGGTAGFNTGSNGTDTSVGTLCVGKGGTGGGGQSSGTAGGLAGSGGTVGTGDVAGVGNPGINGIYISGGTASLGAGDGGATLLGGAGRGGLGSGAAITGGAAAANSGSGGGGGSVMNAATNVAGGNGGSGLVWITEYNSQ